MGFNINNFLNAESKKDIKNDWKPVKVSVRKLRPAPDKTNFYHADDKEIKDLAESIELIGLQQYPVIRPIEDTDEYEVIAGHKRRLAILRLLDEGKTEYEMIPCKVETPDDIRNELILIFTNSTQRERTDYEKMQEIKRVRELLTEYQKTHELTGRKQSIIAGILGTSKTKVGTLDNINNNLIEPFKEEFASGKISTSAANEIAGLEEDANSEMQNISFYIDTELYILKQYEEEINYKLLEPSETAEGKHFKFNENVILRTDAKSQAAILTGYVQNGIYTPNEARSLMNKPRKEGGDELICNGNYIKVADIGKGEGEGEDGETIKITKERQKQPI